MAEHLLAQVLQRPLPDHVFLTRKAPEREAAGL
jgi:hypothetical protein